MTHLSTVRINQDLKVSDTFGPCWATTILQTIASDLKSQIYIKRNHDILKSELKRADA